MRAGEPITAFPLPRLRDALRPAHWKQPDWLGGFTSFHDSARAALYSAFRGLGLGPGFRLWAPSLHCGVEIDAGIAAGLDVMIYRIAADLSVDLEHLSEGLKRSPGAVLLIHYFGFPQPCTDQIRRVCAATGSTLIEDCAHALFSRQGDRELGSGSVASIYSLRKTLPIFDGGALLLRGVPLDAAPAGRVSHVYAFVGKTIVKQLLFRTPAPSVPDRTGALPPLTPGLEPRSDHAGGWSALSSVLAAGSSPESVVRHRRENYLRLDRLLLGVPGYRPVFPALAPGVCPLFLPIWMDPRGPAMQWLRDQGIETFRFGAVPHRLLDLAAFPDAARLRDQILCLPVHQQLSEASVERIAERVQAYLAQTRRLSV